MKIGLVQPEVIPGDPQRNFEQVSGLCSRALAEGAELLLLPENCLSGALLGDVPGEGEFFAECEELERRLCELAGNVPLKFGNAFVLDANGAHEWSGVPEPMPYVHGQVASFRKSLQDAAREHRRAVAYVNAVSAGNAGKSWRAFDGRGLLVAPSGDLVAELPAFEPAVRVVDSESAGRVEPKPETIADLHAAIALQTRTMMEVCGIRNVVVGASGGIDSSVVAALMAKIVPPERMLLVNMPSRHNSATTKGIARRLAENLGTWFAEIPIEPSVELTVAQFGSCELRRGGESRKLELTPALLENVQARDRGSRVLAAAAAAFGGVFTCNGNKAECTVGYATIMGDLSGFFAPIADLWKHEVYALGRFLNESVHGFEAIPRETFEIPPSAELSPAQAVEEGKGDPIVYPYHDFLFRWWTESEERPGPLATLERYASKTLEKTIGAESGIVDRLFPDAASFAADLERWWTLFCGMGSAKRSFAPPLASVSPWAFGSERSESALRPFFPQKYVELKKSLLSRR